MMSSQKNFPMIRAVEVHKHFGSLEVLKDYNRHRLWINPLDADPRGIHDGDKVRCGGELECEVGGGRLAAQAPCGCR